MPSVAARSRFAWILSVTIMVGFVPRAALGQWQKIHEMGRECRENGESLPGGGVILGKYYVGKMKAYQGRDYNQIVVQADVYSVVGTYTQSETQKRRETGYVFCMFFRDDPTSANTDARTRERLFLPDSTQASHEIAGTGTVTIEVPPEAAFVLLTLSQNRTNSAGSLERDANSYWSDRLLLQECGAASLSGKYQELWLFDPARRTPLPPEPATRTEPRGPSGLLVKVECPKCQGAGTILVPESYETCPDCGGSGKRRVPGGRLLIKCEHPIGQCNGTGKIKIPEHRVPCDACGGSGKVARPPGEARRQAQERRDNEEKAWTSFVQSVDSGRGAEVLRKTFPVSPEVSGSGTFEIKKRDRTTITGQFSYSRRNKQQMFTENTCDAVITCSISGHTEKVEYHGSAPKKPDVLSTRCGPVLFEFNDGFRQNYFRIVQVSWP